MPAQNGITGIEQTQSDVTLDLEKALSSVGDDRELLGELAVIFDEDLQSYLAALESKLTEQDAEGAHRVLHKLKGATAPFFASPLASQLVRLVASTASGEMVVAEQAHEDLVANLHGLKEALIGHGLLPTK